MGALEDRERLAYLRYHGVVDTQLNALDSDRDFSWTRAGFIAGRADRSADLQGSGQRIAVSARHRTVDYVDQQTQLARGRRWIPTETYILRVGLASAYAAEGRTRRNGYQIDATY